MPGAARGFWVVAVLWAALAVAWSQDKPEPITVWNGQPVEHVGAGVSAPMVIHSVAPTFPESTQARKALSMPQVYFLVDAEGVPQNVHILKSSGNAEFDTNFVESVKQYRFKPAMKDGKPVTVELSMETSVSTF